MKEYEEKEGMLKDAVNNINGSSDFEMFDNQAQQSPKPATDDVEITITPETESPQQDNVPRETIQESPSKETQRKTLTPREGRLARAERKAAELQAALGMAIDENESLRQQNIQAHNFSTIQRENQLKERIESLKGILRQAKEEGNIDQEIKATELMSKFNAEFINLKQNKQYIQQQPAYQPPYEQAQYQEPGIPNQELEAIQDVISEHDWLDENSPNFDPSLTEEAAMARDALASQWRINRKGHQVGSYDFYKEVANMVERRFNAAPAQATRQPYPSGRIMTNNQRQQYVAPVNRNYDTGNIQRAGNRVNVNLTPEQRDLARRMTYDTPNLSNAEKEMRYAKALVNLTQNGRL